MNLLSKIFKEAIENGEVEIRIRITRNDKVGEVYEKIEKLLLLFPPNKIEIVPVRKLKKEEELEILEEVMSDGHPEKKIFL